MYLYLYLYFVLVLVIKVGFCLTVIVSLFCLSLGQRGGILSTLTVFVSVFAYSGILSALFNCNCIFILS